MVTIPGYEAQNTANLTTSRKREAQQGVLAAMDGINKLAELGMSVAQQEAEARGKESGIRLQVTQGADSLIEFTGLEGFTASGRARRKAAEDTFLIQREGKISNEINRIVLENPGNPEAIRQAIEERRMEFTEGVPANLVGAFTQLIERGIAGGERQAEAMRIQRDNEERAFAIVDRAGQLRAEYIDTFNRNPNDPKLQQIQTQLQGLVETASSPTEAYKFNTQALRNLQDLVAATPQMAQIYKTFDAAGAQSAQRMLVDLRSGTGMARGMPESVRREMIGQLSPQMQIKQQQESLARQEQTLARNVASQGVSQTFQQASGLVNSGRTVPIDQMQMDLDRNRNLFTPQQFQQYQTQLNALRTANDFNATAMEWTMPETMANAQQRQSVLDNPLASVEAKAQAARELSLLQPRMNAYSNFVNKGEYWNAALASNPALTRGMDFSTPEGINRAAEVAAAATGLPPHLFANTLPPNVQQSIINTYQQAPPEQRATMANDSVRRYGESNTLQALGTDGAVAVAQSRLGVINPTVAANIQLGHQNLEQLRRDQAQTLKQADVDNAVNAEIQRMRLGGDDSMVFRTSVEALARRYLFNGQSNPMDRAIADAKRMFQNVTVGNQTLHVPQIRNGQNFQPNVSHMNQTLGAIQANPDIAGLIVPMRGNITLEDRTRFVRENTEVRFDNKLGGFVLAERGTGQVIFRRDPTTDRQVPVRLDSFQLLTELNDIYRGNMPSAAGGVEPSQGMESIPVIAP
jgi:hypothetical protein